MVGITVIAVIGSLYYIVPALYVVAVVGTLIFRNSSCIILSCILVALSVIPTPINTRSRNHWVLRTICEYFNLRWIEDTPQSSFDVHQQYIACWLPHGIIPFSGIAAGSVFDAISPRFYGSVAMAAVLFKMPVLRQFFALFNGIPADRKSMVNALNNGKSVSVYPGGVAELFLSRPDQESIYIKRRKGFIRLALETGSHICPYYTFGNNLMYDVVSDSKGKPGILSTMSRKLGASIILFYGRFGLPIAKRVNVLIVRGPAIVVDKVSNPTQVQIDELHHKVIDEIQILFDKYKAIAGEQHAYKELQIK